MRNTTRFGWPYPEAGDHTRTWEYWATYETIDTTVYGIKTTVDANAAAVAKLPARIQASSHTVHVAQGATSASKTMTFPVAFAAVPTVCANMAQAPGAITGWTVRAINASATQVTFFLAGPVAASAVVDMPVDWIASARTATPN